MIAVQTIIEWLASFIETVLYFAVIHSVSENQFQKKKQTFLFLFISVAVSMGIILLNFVEISISLPTLLYATIAFALGACILYRGRFVEFLFASIGFLACIIFMDMLAVSIMNRLGMGNVVTEILSGFNIKRVLFIAVVKIIESTVVYMLCTLLRKSSVHLKMTRGYAITVMCLMLGGIGSVYWVTQAEILIGIALNPFQMMLGISCVLVVCTIYLLFRIREARREREYTSRQNQILEQNYQIAKQSYESNAKLYHDMRNHFVLVQNYLAAGKISEAQEYLEKISGDRTTYPIEHWTGIAAVDYILSQKVDAARQQGIETAIHAEYPKDCKIDPVDLCTILTNLLDNAIDACTKQPEEAGKKIMVTIRRIHQFIIIRIANSSTAMPTVQNGSFITSKHNKKQHGWGIRSVKSAVEKYQGTMEFDYSDSFFTVSIMLFYK